MDSSYLVSKFELLIDSNYKKLSIYIFCAELFALKNGPLPNVKVFSTSVFVLFNYK